MKQFNKLIRDRIPEFIEKDGKKYNTRILTDDEYRTELLRKLTEESQEAFETGGAREDLIKEIADIWEVMDYVIKEFGLDQQEIFKVKEDRKEKRGGFDKKLFLEEMEE